MKITAATFSAMLALLAAGPLTLPAAAGSDVFPDDAPYRSEDGRDLVPSPLDPDADQHFGGASGHVAPHVAIRPLSSTTVKAGAPVEFNLYSSVDGFAHLYVLSASGRVQVWMENLPIEAMRRMHYPPAGITITASSPPGIDDVVLVVTKQRFDGILGRQTTRSPRVIGHDPGAFKRRLNAKLGTVPRAHWTFARSKIRVVGPSGWPVTSPEWPTDL